MLNNVEILLHATRGRWPLLPHGFSLHQHLQSIIESGKTNEQPQCLHGLYMMYMFIPSISGEPGDVFFNSSCRHVVLTSGALDPIEMR